MPRDNSVELTYVGDVYVFSPSILMRTIYCISYKVAPNIRTLYISKVVTYVEDRLFDLCARSPHNNSVELTYVEEDLYIFAPNNHAHYILYILQSGDLCGRSPV